MCGKDNSDRPIVELVKSKYQPSKAELEADIRLRKGGPITLGDLEDAAKELVRPVDIRWVRRPTQ